MGVPHFLVMPFPVQGQVNPIMQFSQLLAKHGCKVTVLNSEFNQNRIEKAGADEHNNLIGSQIRLVSLPDGLAPENDRSNILEVIFSISSSMPALLPRLIEDVNALDLENKITCIVVSMNMGWALEVGHQLEIKGALLWVASATSLASCDCIQRLIDDGIIDSEGLPTKKQKFQLSPNLPMMYPEALPWVTLGKNFFPFLVKEIQRFKLGEWWLCNTSYDLEPEAFSISPRLLPIGPLMENETNRSSFWQEDITCLDWLDQHPPQSVIYVSFGSLAVVEPNQIKELALALDLLDRPFLWVVRPSTDNNVNNAYPDEFHGSKGKIVSWAPQKKILNHPAIACFISHCGWNSTIEGLYGGVPFLCWPFFIDQFMDRFYICHVWKVGLGFEKDENGLISKEEIREKVEQLLGHNYADIKARSLKLKEMTMNNIAEDGLSSKNLHKFINWAKQSL